MTKIVFLVCLFCFLLKASAVIYAPVYNPATALSPIANMNGMVDNLTNNTTIPTNYWTDAIVTMAHATNTIGANEVFDSAGATSVKNWVPGFIFTNNTCILTNPTVTFVAGNPWTISWLMRAPIGQAGAQALWVSTSTGFYLKDTNKLNIVFSGSDHEGSDLFTNWTIPTVVTATCDGVNPVLIYIGGKLSTNTITRPTVNMVLQAVGNNGSSNLFAGALMNWVWATNYQAGATEVSNIVVFQCTNNCPIPTDYTFRLPLNEGIGTTINQTAGTPYTFSITGSNSWATDGNGNPYLKLLNGGFLDTGTNNSSNTCNTGIFSVSGWVNFTTLTSGDNGKNSFVDKITGDAAGTGWEMGFKEGSSQGTGQRHGAQNAGGTQGWEPQNVSTWGTQLPSGLTLMATNQWRFVCAVFNTTGGNYYGFNDGVRIFAAGDQVTFTGSIASTNAITVATSGAHFGSTACGASDIQGYSRNLTPLEIVGLWRSGLNK